MSKNIVIGVLLLVTGILIGMNLPALSAQQREARRGPPPLPTMDQLPQEVATLRQLIPTNSTIMMDVQWHWTNLWWAGKRRNWPLARPMTHLYALCHVAWDGIEVGHAVAQGARCRHAAR